MIVGMGAVHDEASAAGGPAAEEIAAPLVDRLLAAMAHRDGPLVVGLDGRSGSGKSTLAEVLVARLGRDQTGRPTVTVIEGDLFYAGGSGATWDLRTAAQKADRVIDWRRQRTVLEDLLRAGWAEWHPFDWDADDWDADDVSLSREPVRAVAAPVVVLEGAYSCRPELHDLLDLRVLLEIPHEVRRRRLRDREGDEYHDEWDARWSAAEEHYFGSVMPPHRFDLVLRPA